MANRVATLAPKTEQEWVAIGFRIKTLFTPAAPISRSDLLAGRKQEIGRLIDAVLEQGRHAVLFGERGVGKTSLANTFHEVISQAGDEATRTIRKQAAPGDTFSGLWRKIFRDLQFKVTEDVGYGRDSTQTYTAADVHGETITPDDILRVLGQLPQTPFPIIIFDEFDRVADEETKKLMSHTIKAITDDGINATVVLVGVAEDINLLVAEHQSIERNIAEIKMPRMSKGEMNEILDKRLPDVGMKLDGDARWKIIALARGLPEYVHFLGRDAALNAVKSRRLSVIEEDVDAAIGSFLLQSDQSANNAYRRAIESNNPKALHRQVLLACALTKTDDEGKFVPKDVVQPLARLLGHKVGIDNFQSHLTAFSGDARGQILEKTGRPRAYRYRFREPKMQPYVIMRGIADDLVPREAMEILSAPEQPRLSNDF